MVLLSADSVRKFQTFDCTPGAARFDAVCVKSKTCKPRKSLTMVSGQSFHFCGSVRGHSSKPIKIILFHQQYRPLPFRICARHAYCVPLPPDMPPDPAQLRQAIQEARDSITAEQLQELIDSIQQRYQDVINV